MFDSLEERLGIRIARGGEAGGGGSSRSRAQEWGALGSGIGRAIGSRFGSLGGKIGGLGGQAIGTAGGLGADLGEAQAPTRPSKR